MNGKDCRAARREIDQSELSQRLSEQVETHLLDCAACAQFRAERRELRELVGSLQPVGAPADFDLRLRARIARERDTRARQPFIFRFALTTPAIAVAALLVMLVGTIVWVNQKDKTQTNQSAATRDIDGNENKTATAGAPAPAQDKSPANDQLASGGSDRRLSPKQSPAPVKKSSPVLNQPQSSDSVARSAPVIQRREDREGEVSVTAPSKPMVVSVQDANGKTHKILLPPVSFGSQRFDTRTPVSMTNRRDW